MGLQQGTLLIEEWRTALLQQGLKVFSQVKEQGESLARAIGKKKKGIFWSGLVLLCLIGGGWYSPTARGKIREVSKQVVEAVTSNHQQGEIPAMQKGSAEKEGTYSPTQLTEKTEALESSLHQLEERGALQQSQWESTAAQLQKSLLELTSLLDTLKTDQSKLSKQVSQLPQGSSSESKAGQSSLPKKSGTSPSPSTSSSTESESNTGTAAGLKLSLNTATASQLDGLPGIGPAYAQRIVEYRQQKGSFKKVEDLLEVPGIGPTTLAKIKDLITL